jgi:hypothetical protein
MQAQIEQRVRPAVQLLVQHQVDHLRGQSDEKMAALRDCLGQIDRSVLQCLAGLDEYQKRYADLDTLNKSLAGLGVPPEPLPEKISIQQLSETISARLAIRQVHVSSADLTPAAFCCQTCSRRISCSFTRVDWVKRSGGLVRPTESNLT